LSPPAETYATRDSYPQLLLLSRKSWESQDAESPEPACSLAFATTRNSGPPPESRCLSIFVNPKGVRGRGRTPLQPRQQVPLTQQIPQGAPDAGYMPVVSGYFHYHMAHVRIPRFGDRPAALSGPAGRFPGHQACIRHHLPRRAEPLQIVQLCHQGDGGH
jgi:hypothetical protein